jgi:hypothetical protein
MPKATNNSSKPHEDNNVIEVVSLNGCTNLDGGVDTTTPTINMNARLGDGTCMPKTNSVARSHRLQDKRLYLVAVTVSCLKKTLVTFSIQLHPNKKICSCSACCLRTPNPLNNSVNNNNNNIFINI